MARSISDSSSTSASRISSGDVSWLSPTQRKSRGSAEALAVTSLPEGMEGVEEEIHGDARQEQRRESHERHVDGARPPPAQPVVGEEGEGEDAPDREREPDLGIGE